MARITLTVGPSDDAPGVAWGYQDATGEILDSGGWGQDAPSSGPRSETVEGWFALARRRIPLLPAIRAARLRWADGEAEPFGWSPASGHAPGGIKVTWEW